ncbi:MAG: hypothetical protein IJF92_00995 [Bacilli bacterium]|nr:hypothetical protein [Bacilli bacterium]
MKKVNNRGFAVSTMLYTLILMMFMIVLSIMSMLGTTRSNTKNLSDDIKKDLLQYYDKDDPICRRVSGTNKLLVGKCPLLKQASCYDNHCYNCRHDPTKLGGYAVDANITYGQVGTPGVFKSGDVFVCDVNGDGNFQDDPNGDRNKLELFFYVTDLESDSDYAVLIFFANVSGGKFIDSNKKSGFAYSNNTTATLTAAQETCPNVAVNQLPTTSQWKNVKLTNETRRIKDEDGVERVTCPYTNRAARLPTYDEIKAACPTIAKYNSSITGDTPLGQAKGYCEYFVIYTTYDSGKDNEETKGYWLETVSTAPKSMNKHLIVDGMGRNVYPLKNDKDGQNIGVRPVIEVPKSKIEY